MKTPERILRIFILAALLSLSSCLPASQKTALPAGSTPEEAVPSQAPPSPTAESFPEITPGSEQYAVVGLLPEQTLELRQDHSLDSESLGQVPASATSLTPRGNILDIDGIRWIQVDYQGQTGWVDFSYLAEQHGNLPEEVIILGQEVLAALKAYRYDTLAGYVHPELCVRFSPYTYLRPESLTFCPADLPASSESDAPVLWGYFDGSGAPIELSFQDYHQRFVYDQDFFQAPVIGFNTEVSSGNSINNIPEVFPDGMMIEYYFPGFDPQYGGMDWRSLRLVFVQLDGAWYLTAIIHCEWTI